MLRILASTPTWGIWKKKNPWLWLSNRFFLISSLNGYFFLRASIAATEIFTAHNCTATIIPLEPCALNDEIQHFVLSFRIWYWDLIKFPYFMDTTKRGVRGWKEAQRQGEDKVNLLISLLVPYCCFICNLWTILLVCVVSACIKYIKFSVVKRGITHLNVNLTLLKVLEESN